MADRDGTLRTGQKSEKMNHMFSTFERGSAPCRPLAGSDLDAVGTLSDNTDTDVNGGATERTPYTLSMPNKKHKRTVLCQVRGCCVNLTQLGKQYSIRKRVCPHHLTADSVLLDSAVFGDQKFRFCHQCGKLEPLTAFDGAKRSCRSRLLKRRQSQRHHRVRAGKLDAFIDEESADEDYEPACNLQQRRERDNQRDSHAPKGNRSELRSAQQQYLRLSAADWSNAALAAEVQRQQGRSVTTTESKAERSPGTDEVTGPTVCAAGVGANVYTIPAAATYQPSNGQQQQQGSMRMQSSSGTDPSWENMLQAIANGSSSAATDGMDVQLLHQLELELAAEQQLMQQQHGHALGGYQPLAMQAAVGAAATPESVPTHNQGAPAVTPTGKVVGNAQTARLPSPATAAKVAAALMSDISSLLEPAAAGSERPSGYKMALVNKLLDVWCQEASTYAGDMTDEVTESLEQQLLTQTSNSSNKSSTLQHAFAARAQQQWQQQQQIASAVALNPSVTQQQALGTAASVAAGCFAAPAALDVNAPPAVAAAGNQMQSYQMLSPDSAATAVYTPCPPVNMLVQQQQQQQQAPVAAWSQCIDSNAQPPAAAADLTMHNAVPAAAMAPPAAAAAPAVAAAPTPAFERLWLLQRKVDEMSSQLSQLQGVMASQVQELMGMTSAAQSNHTNYPAAPAGMVTHQMPGCLQHQPSGWSNATTANLGQRQMSWNPAAGAAVPNWQP